MRILQLVTRFDFGGAENHVRELCNELVANNHQVILVSRNGRQKELLDNRVIFIPIPSLVSNFILAQAILIVYLNVRHKIDVIHAHQRLPIITACLAGFISRVPVVATVHGRVRHDLRSVIARKFASKIIFVSNQVLTISRHFESIKHKSVVIPNGIPIPQKFPKIESFTIGYFSRIDERHFEVIKNLVLAVEKFTNDYPNIKLLLIGDGKEVEKLKLMIHDSNLRLNDNVIQYRGFVENLEDWSSFPELVFGVGRVAIEALARGANVLSVNYKRMGEIISLSNYGQYALNNFVNISGIPPTSEKMYSQLKLYYQKRNEYRAETPALALKIENDFSISKTTQSIVEVYSTVS
mgnify:CR=1 FL=1